MHRILPSTSLASCALAYSLLPCPTSAQDSATSLPANRGTETDAVTNAEQAGRNEPDESAGSRRNWPMKTAGGMQLWTDFVYRRGYRIQQHAVTGHWRLLDPKEVRRGWGTREQCRVQLDRLCPTTRDPEAAPHGAERLAGSHTDARAPADDAGSPRIVVVLHGLMRSHRSMKPLARKLEKELETEVIRFSYASTRRSIADHAAALRQVLEGLPPDARLSFVGHSMGNIVIRHLIGDLQRDGDPTDILGRSRAMVMLGPPNHGAAIARKLAPTGLYGLVTGKGGMELGPKWEEFVHRLAVPPFPFAIVAGDLSHLPIRNPLVDTSGDLIVSVDETRLDGAVWVKTVPVLHSALMFDDRAAELTIEFLRQKQES